MPNEIEVKRTPDGTLMHRHEGYDGWHPANQKHKHGLHQSLGITGKETPNRRSSESIGMKDPASERKPTRSKPVGQNRKPEWDWTGNMTIKDYFKTYATARPSTKAGRTMVTAVNMMKWLYMRFQNKMEERDAKYASQGFEDAFSEFDKHFSFHGSDDFDKLTANDIRRIDAQLAQLARDKYNEYGGPNLKGKRDAESIRRKAEIRTYLELRDRLREQAEKESRRGFAHEPRSSTRPTSARDIRERNKRNNS